METARTGGWRVPRSAQPRTKWHLAIQRLRETLKSGWEREGEGWECCSLQLGCQWQTGAPIWVHALSPSRHRAQLQEPCHPGAEPTSLVWENQKPKTKAVQQPGPYGQGRERDSAGHMEPAPL